MDTLLTLDEIAKKEKLEVFDPIAAYQDYTAKESREGHEPVPLEVYLVVCQCLCETLLGRR